jgi:hypothetical protein
MHLQLLDRGDERCLRALDFDTLATFNSLRAVAHYDTVTYIRALIFSRSRRDDTCSSRAHAPLIVRPFIGEWRLDHRWFHGRYEKELEALATSCVQELVQARQAGRFDVVSVVV